MYAIPPALPLAHANITEHVTHTWHLPLQPKSHMLFCTSDCLYFYGHGRLRTPPSFFLLSLSSPFLLSESSMDIMEMRSPSSLLLEIATTDDPLLPSTSFFSFSSFLPLFFFFFSFFPHSFQLPPQVAPLWLEIVATRSSLPPPSTTILTLLSLPPDSALPLQFRGNPIRISFLCLSSS